MLFPKGKEIFSEISHVQFLQAIEGGGREWELETALFRHVLRSNIRQDRGRGTFPYKASSLKAKRNMKIGPAHQGKTVNAVVEYTCAWDI